MMLALVVTALLADTYHVSPTGDDAKDGRSPANAWKTVAKANAAPLKPGDQVLFARGGEWRESLQASASGAPGKPITFAAYGSGAKPKFWGSDVVQVGADGALKSDKPVAALLQDHQFLAPGAWRFADGVLQAKPGTYTACVRVDLVYSNGKNHLVFKDLIADESADVRDGYCFRVMGSDDVRLEDCEAYRAGRHHYGAINSTNVVGLRLKCAYAMPGIPGGATFYVSFSDAARKNDTHQWIDCSAEHLENPGQGNYQIFYDHGEGLGPITIRNMVSRGGKLSVGSSAAAPVTILGGLIEDASLEVFGDHLHVDGLAVKGNGAVDLFCSDSLLENMVVAVEPRNGGPTGYGAGFVLRDNARRNVVRYSTAVLGDAPCVMLTKPGLEMKLVGNVLLSKKGVFGDEHSAPLEGNFSGGGDALLDAQYRPKPGSPLLGAGKGEHPDHDQAGRKRPTPCALGAFEPGK